MREIIKLTLLRSRFQFIESISRMGSSNEGETSPNFLYSLY